MPLRAEGYVTAFALAAAALVASGCELVAAPDRSKISEGAGGAGGTGGATTATTTSTTTSGTGGMGTGGMGTGGGTGGMGTGGGTGGMGTGGGTGGMGTGGGTGGMGTGGMGTGGMGTGGMGTGGMANPCTIPADCADTGSECIARTCNAGTCGTTNVADHTPTAAQAPGDCKTSVCDGNGALTFDDDDNDAPQTEGTCVNVTCSGGSGQTTNKPLGTGCTFGGSVCDGAGNCVACNTNADCGGGICASNACVSPTCGDGFKNGGEADTDCGGPNCAGCIDGKTCIVNPDCQSSVCSGGTCQIPSCVDTAKNGNETDLNCGGNVCPKCGDLTACKVNGDCQSGVCSALLCQAAICPDGVKNGGETDTDCGGGSCATKCAVGDDCVVDGDCATGICTGGSCAEINGCGKATALDLTALQSTTIVFGVGANVYAPPCIRVAAGTAVTFSGNFGAHPLQGGNVVNGVATADPSSPFFGPITSPPQLPFTMSTAGTFPYYCDFHYPSGMMGVVFVDP